MPKPLSEMIAEIHPKTAQTTFGEWYISPEDFDRLGQVAIELARACETTSVMDNELGRWCKRAINRAKEIIGVVK